MIDVSKLLGSPQAFQPDRVKDLLNKGLINNVSNLEKAIFSLEYVGQLHHAGLDFLFKGGSAVQILLGELCNRLSVDVDICTDASEDELADILEGVRLRFGGEAFTYEKRGNEAEKGSPFYLYRIKTPSMTGRRRVILLDALGMKPGLAMRRTPLRTFYYESSIEVTTPTVGSLLGDKLSIIGPNTIGRPLRDSRNGLEYAKHLYDIGILSDSKPDFRECIDAYRESLRIQNRIRGRDFGLVECLDDAVFTCQVASLPQRFGERAIENLKQHKRDRAHSEYRILRDGLRRFRPFLVRNHTYMWDNLREYASRTALLIKTIRGDLTCTKLKEILNQDVPKSREEIRSLVERIQTIPEEDRWFIIVDEIVNFPLLLKSWFDFLLN